MFSVNLEEKSYKMSFKALPVKYSSEKIDNVSSPPSPPGADRVKKGTSNMKVYYILPLNYRLTGNTEHF